MTAPQSTTHAAAPAKAHKPRTAWGLRDRLSGLVTACAGTALLSVAAWLRPDEEGHGTHEQLLLPRCGWVSLFDKPCPTCGMTTSFSHAAEGNLAQAATTQPLGAMLSVLTAVLIWGGLHSALTGARIGGFATRLINRWTLTGGLVLLLLAWGYKLLTWNG